MHCIKEELDNEAEETAFFKEMSEDFITQIKWLNNTIEVYRGEVDEDTIRRVEYTVQQLRESFGDDYEVWQASSETSKGGVCPFVVSGAVNRHKALVIPS